MDAEISREQRVAWAREALICYAIGKEGEMYGDGDIVIVDLLADLMHYCAAKDINFREVLEQARGHYAVEG